MGFVSNLFGGSGGGNFQASGAGNQPTSAILNPTNVNQASGAYNQAQSGLSQQQNFLNQLAGQNGIQNQSNVYNQLQGVANGTGPNPAQAQLAQATGANTATQAALMAGQRGAGANVGLLARQAAQQGAANQQNAVGQAATLQANQSLGALNQLGGIAGQQVGQQANALSQYNQGAQSEQQNLLNSIAAQNNSNVGMQSNINSANAGIQGTVAQGQQGLLGGVLGGVGSALGLAKGGMVPHFDQGGMAQPQSKFGQYLYNSANQSASMPSASAPNFSGMTGNGSGASSLYQGMAQLGQGIGKAFASNPNQPQEFNSSVSGASNAPYSLGVSSSNSNAPMDMPAQSSFDPFAKPFARGGVINGPMYASMGKKIPGKAEVKGNSLKNDKVPAMLSPGEVIIPRSVMNSKDPAGNAAKFVAAVQAKSRSRS